LGSGEMLVGAGGKVFFAVYDSLNTTQLFIESDEALQNIQVNMPPTANTAHPFNVILSCGMIDIFDFKIWNDKVIVPANFNDAGRELWVFDAGLVSDIPQEGTANKFAVFPNPAHNELFLTTEGDAYCDKHISITNVTGEVCVQSQFTGNKSSINISDLPTGNYFVTLSENGKAIGTKQLVFMK
jgi:hypothetical protein